MAVESRLKAIASLFAGNPRVEVTSFAGLTVDMARKCGADALLRGVRSISDFEYERNPPTPTVRLPSWRQCFYSASRNFRLCRGSMVRELMHNGYGVSKYIAGEFPIPPAKFES